MTPSKLLLGTVVLVAMTISSGVIQGHLSNRWGTPVDLLAAARKLEQIPHTCGPWELEQAEKLDDNVTQELDCVGYVLRTYVHRDTQMRAQVAVILGPPGPTSVHTPDICYSARDYRTLHSMERWSFADGQRHHSLWEMTLEPSRLESGGFLRVHHAWTSGNEWLAPEHARLAFASSKYLYKIQLACPLVELADAGTDKDTGRQFLTHFIPAMQPFLVPADN